MNHTMNVSKTNNYRNYEYTLQTKTRVMVWHRQAIYDTFKVFKNSDLVICDHLEYFKMALIAYRHFIDDDHEITLEPYQEFFGEDRDVFKEVARAKFNSFWKSKKDDPFEDIKVSPRKRKGIVTSLIERKYWHDVPEDLESKGFQDPDATLLESMLSTHPDFYNLGDSRSFENADELINKMQIARDARMYIGSCCAWSNWTAENGVPTYITFNALTGCEHHSDTLVKQILPHLRKGYVQPILK